MLKHFWTPGPILKWYLALWLRFPKVWARGEPRRPISYPTPSFLDLPKTQTSVIGHLKSQLYAFACIANREFCIADANLCHKDTDYMPQRYKLYVSKIQTICFKDANSVLQIHNFYVLHTDFCCKYTHCLCLREISVYCIHRICISVFYIHRICII